MITFTTKGLLWPDRGIEVSHQECQQVFTEDPLPGYEHRKRLWQQYETWLADYRVKVDPRPEVWIDGSFVSQRAVPRDIDLVVKVPSHRYHHPSVQDYFQLLLATKPGPDEPGGLDLYPLVVYPEAHPEHDHYLSDAAYWQHFFSRTRPNRRNPHGDRKGFIILRYG